jgi:hypothetical protein
MAICLSLCEFGFDSPTCLMGLDLGVEGMWFELNRACLRMN